MRIDLYLYSVFLLTFSTVAYSDFFINVGSSDEQAVEYYCTDKLVSGCFVGIEDVSQVLARLDYSGDVNDDVRVVFASGVHRLLRPINVNWGKRYANRRLFFSGSKQEQTVINGAVIINKFNSGRVSGNYLEFDFNEASYFLGGFNSRGYDFPVKPHIGEVFQDGVRLNLARWPREGYFYLSSKPSVRNDSFIIDRNDGDGFSEYDDEVFVFSYWKHNWADQTVLVHYDHEHGGKVLQPISFGIGEKSRAVVYNRFNDFRERGDWAYSRKNRKIFVKPFFEIENSVFELSFSNGAFLVSNSQNVFFEDIFFEKFRGDVFYIENSTNVVLDRINFSYFGNRALVVSGGKDCGVRNSVIAHGGEGGVVLDGGERHLLIRGNNFAENSLFYHLNNYAASYRPAVKIFGVGQRVVNNVIHDLPHSAITFHGNDHVIKGNEIYNVVQDTSDAGAIYVGYDFTSRGTVIEGNFLHDIDGFDSGFNVKGVYLDDQASGIAIRDNLFARVQQPVFIGGGRDNVVEYNLFYESSPAVYLDARGLTWQKAATLDPNGELQLRLSRMPINGFLWKARYSNLSNILSDEFGAPKYNKTCGNYIFNGKPPYVERDAISGIDLTGFVFLGENAFVKQIPSVSRHSRGDFKLRSESKRSCSY